MTRDTCRSPWCDRDSSTGRFCSKQCKAKYEHIKADAKEARLDDQAELEEEL